MFNIFCSYLLEDNFKFDIKKYKKEILNLKSVRDTVNVSNYGGWQSGSFETPILNILNLFERININIKEIEKKLSLTKKLRLHNLWYNVNGLASFNRPHDHMDSIVSGVYYVSIPIYQDQLFFGKKPIKVYYRHNVKNYNKYNSSTWKINPEENKCILFPSYLQHYVEPNFNKKEKYKF